MGKFFCLKCGGITYALRYFKSNSKWYKPKKNLRYCENCDNTFPESKLETLGKIKT